MPLINAINQYHPYNNIQLAKFIIELEKKYRIENKIQEYKSYVNFSKNLVLPYHSWFKYREGYSSALMKKIISDSNITDSEYIIDPFCGSGTTIVEGALLNINGLGVDINPMSALISKVKTYSYSNEQIKKIKKYKNDITLLKIDNDASFYEDIARYFNEDIILSLTSIKKFINKIKESKIKDFFMLCFLSIIEDVSNRKRDGNGLKTIATKVDNAIHYFINKMDKMLLDIENNPIKRNCKFKLISGNALNLHKYVKQFNQKSGLIPNSIIFSPPYANSFDYFESYKLELRLGEFVNNISELKTLRSNAVRSFISTNIGEESHWFINEIAKEIEQAIPEKEAITGKKDNRTRKVPSMVKGYFNDMEEVIKECSLSLPNGKKTYIIVDQSAYLGKIIPTDLFLASIAEKYSFKVEKIIVCRIAKTSGQQIKRFPYLSNSLRESIVILEKI